MKQLAYSLSEAHVQRARLARVELIHAERAPVFFTPARVAELRRRYELALR